MFFKRKLKKQERLIEQKEQEVPCFSKPKVNILNLVERVAWLFQKIEHTDNRVDRIKESRVLAAYQLNQLLNLQEEAKYFKLKVKTRYSGPVVEVPLNKVFDLFMEYIGIEIVSVNGDFTEIEIIKKQKSSKAKTLTRQNKNDTP